MRRILVVDDDRHTRLAIGIWLKQCGFRVAITDGGESGLAALNDGTFDLMIVDVLMANMRGFESIRVPQPRADRPADRDLRLRFFRPGNGRSRLLQDGAQPRRDAVPAQAVPAGDAARRDR
jgi:CheY-like chemotaxis protein